MLPVGRSCITNQEEVEDTSGQGEQECWFGGGCYESFEMESGSWREWGKSGYPRLRG